MSRLIHERSRWTTAVAGIALTAVLCLTACGRKGDPLGVDQVRPRTISALTSETTPKGVHLEWRRTSTYLNGKRMDDLGGFLVFRGLPGQSSEQIADIPVSDRDRFRTEKDFDYLDQSAAPGATYFYRVISYTTDRYYSLPSNQVTVTLQRP